MNKQNGPYIKNKNNTNKIMSHLIISLLPIILFSFYKNGIIPFIHNKTDILGMIYPLIFILMGTLSTGLFEGLYAKFILKEKDLKNYLTNSYSFMPGLFLSLILPINTPISILILGAFVSIIIGKMLFGGFGNNVFNPALIGRLFIISTYAIVISNNGGYLNSYEIDTISSATPLSNVSTAEGFGTYETLVEPYGTLSDFFIGTIPGAVGETSALLCILAFIYLTVTKTIKWRIPICYVGTVFIMTLLIAMANGLGIWYPLFQIFSGGLLFGAVFMATDPVTSPTTPIGQVIYGLLLGILTVVFRYLTPYPEGVLTSILTMNMLVFIIDKIGLKGRLDYKKVILPFTTISLLMLIIPIGISSKYNKKENNIDPNYNIISSEKIGNNVIYVVTQKGYVGNIRAEITINNSKILSIEILEQNESFYQKIVDINYINKLIQEQNNIKNVDTISGVTVTSTALKKMVINTLEDYGENYE